jgi:hypothetical protein
MHIADLDRGMLGANGIVGGGPPLGEHPPPRGRRPFGTHNICNMDPVPETLNPAE